MKSKAFNYGVYENWIDPNEVQPYENNAKMHDEKQIRNLVNSINKYGWQQDTVLTRDNVLIVGHGRRLAAIKIGCKMPYHYVDKNAADITEEDIREYRLVDNLTNESPWNFEMRDVEVEDLEFDGFEFSFMGQEDDEYTAPESFKEYGDEMQTTNRCPRCGYEWN